MTQQAKVTHVSAVRRVAIVGAGGHGKAVADALLALAQDTVAGFLDDDPRLAGGLVMGLPVLGPIQAWRNFPIDMLVPAIGPNTTRRDLFMRETSRGATMGTVVHPAATLSQSARIGAGTILLAGAVVNVDAVIGENAIVNSGAIVEHDCRIGAHAHLAPGSCIGGDVVIGEGTLLGLGSRVLPGVRIGRWCIVGAGAVVIRDLEDHAKVVGVPARPLQ